MYRFAILILLKKKNAFEQRLLSRHFHYFYQGSKCLYLGIDDERKDVGTTGRKLSYFFLYGPD